MLFHLLGGEGGERSEPGEGLQTSQRKSDPSYPLTPTPLPMGEGLFVRIPDYNLTTLVVNASG